MEEGIIRIVVLQRGWAAVGHYFKEGTEVTLTCSSIIRRWGTTRGLGEIARDGPTAETVLDPCGTIGCHELGVVLWMKCAQTKWADHVH